MTNRPLAENEKGVFPLVDGKKVEVVIRHGADRENRVGLAVTPPGQGEIVYRSVCGKFFPIVTNYQTKGRERLILRYASSHAQNEGGRGPFSGEPPGDRVRETGRASERHSGTRSPAAPR